MNESFKQEVRDKIKHKPRLVPVFASTHSIPERLFEYNPRLFLCFNSVEERFEVHGLDQAESYNATLPYRALDARALRWIMNNDIRLHGERIFQELKAQEEAREKAQKREFQNWVEDIGSETQSLIAKDAWL